jgi:CitMHS family citrate-Mg2+:H+ or citrate-Ca2+:H+ symporter
VAGQIAGLPGMIADGIQSIAPTGVMFVFAILFFGILLDAGTFQPIIGHLLKIAGNDPVKIALATAGLSMLVHLDGSGAVTFLVVIPAMVPIYDQMGMKRINLACIVALAAGTMNILPWGGPTIRAATALNVSVTTLFNPILIPFLFGLVTVLVIAYFLGKSEKKRIGEVQLTPNFKETNTTNDLHRPKLFWVNIL